MTLETDVMTEDVKGVLPEYDSKTTKELWDIYSSFHEINPEKKINKPRDRDKRVRIHRKPLTKIIEDTLGEDNENLESFEEREAKQKASDMIAKIAYSHLKGIDSKAKPPTEEGVREFLQKSGVDISYEDLLKQIMNASNLTYEQLENSAPHLKRIIDYTASYKDTEGKKIEILQQYLGRPEHHEGLREHAGKALSKEYNATSTPQEIFGQYQGHIQSKVQEYELDKKTTFSKSVKKSK